MPLLTLEALLVTEKATLSFERIEGGKIRVKATSWDDAKTILPDQGAGSAQHRRSAAVRAQGPGTGRGRPAEEGF
jgi:hypothetical protein